MFPEPRWHLEISEINLSLQRDQFRNELLVDGITLIPKVDIELLLDKMTEADAAMFRKRNLYNPSFDSRSISRIISQWQQGMQLIPPMIMVFTQEYADTLGIDIITSNELMPIDGKHRINVAYSFGTKSIPILIRNRQLSIVTELLYGHA